jgi:hypothetical protein
MPSFHFIPRLVTASAALAIAMVGSMRAAEITLPAETARLVESPLPGYSNALASCATCHSADYVRMQPTFTRATWKAEVVKMQKVFGAPIPDAAIEPIADYLVKTYGAERPAATPPRSRTGVELIRFR